MLMADGNTIIVSADFGHALFVLEKHVKAASELTAVITAINDHAVDLDDDAMDEIVHEKWRHEVCASAIADALQIACTVHGIGARHMLGPHELAAGACKHCGAKIVVEEVKQ